jgi:hypothetical protein
MNCSAQHLAQAAASYAMMPMRTLLSIKSNLLCGWSNHLTPTPPIPPVVKLIPSGSLYADDGGPNKFQMRLLNYTDYQLTPGANDSLINLDGLFTADDPLVPGQVVNFNSTPYNYLGFPSLNFRLIGTGPGVPVTAILTQISITPSIILADGSGGFWKLIADTLGGVGTQIDPGPATPDLIISDTFGGFWKLIVNSSGLRGTQSDPGPATAGPNAVSDGSKYWIIQVDSSGNIGAFATGVY